MLGEIRGGGGREGMKKRKGPFSPFSLRHL